jgi:hypothetical protein
MKGSTSALAVRLSRLRCVKMSSKGKDEALVYNLSGSLLCLFYQQLHAFRAIHRQRGGGVSRLPPAQVKGRVRRIRKALSRD